MKNKKEVSIRYGTYDDEEGFAVFNNGKCLKSGLGSLRISFGSIKKERDWNLFHVPMRNSHGYQYFDCDTVKEFVKERMESVMESIKLDPSEQNLLVLKDVVSVFLLLENKEFSAALKDICNNVIADSIYKQ
tara:strand:- start:7587 stop:7982 length:396 start_codon:yes stop_codon:yes gene_type:complete